MSPREPASELRLRPALEREPLPVDAISPPDPAREHHLAAEPRVRRRDRRAARCVDAQAIRHYYDKPEYADELERRRKDTRNIDIEEHLHPTDLGTEVSDD